MKQLRAFKSTKQPTRNWFAVQTHHGFFQMENKEAFFIQEQSSTIKVLEFKSWNLLMFSRFQIVTFFVPKEVLGEKIII